MSQVYSDIAIHSRLRQGRGHPRTACILPEAEFGGSHSTSRSVATNASAKFPGETRPGLCKHMKYIELWSAMQLAMKVHISMRENLDGWVPSCQPAILLWHRAGIAQILCCYLESSGISCVMCLNQETFPLCLVKYLSPHDGSYHSGLICKRM